MACGLFSWSHPLSLSYSWFVISQVQVIGSSQLCQPNTYLYRLASVVEHFGRVGSGHYTVYRSVRVESHEENPNEHFETPLTNWFCISDSQVYSVSVNDVLAAEASLLFYERIIESWQYIYYFSQCCGNIT